MYGEQVGEATYCVISDNTSFNNQDGMVIGASGAGGSLLDYAIVSNNIFYGNVRNGLYEEGSLGTNNQYFNNLINGNPSGTSMINGTFVNTVTSAPQFVNYTGDVHWKLSTKFRQAQPSARAHPRALPLRISVVAYDLRAGDGTSGPTNT